MIGLYVNHNSRLNQIQQLGDVLGKGACGKVFKGLNIQTGQLVAIKQITLNKHLKEEQKQNIQQEINLLKRLDHPNIVKYIEYAENGSLDSLIKKFGKLSEPLAAIYIQQVLHGLDFLHQQLVIHRDIKGANILTTKDGIVKLADFGVATKLNESDKGNSVAGTPYWMAPEVIEPSGQVTSACDIWSLGCTIIELMTGKPPYYDLNQFTAMLTIVQKDIPPIPENITEELRDFLIKCFERDPYKRIDAKGLLKHPWLKTYDIQRYKHLSNFQILPEIVNNTIKVHIEQSDKSNAFQRSQSKKSKESSLMKDDKSPGKKPDNIDDDEDLGDCVEDIDDMNDVPIEKPKSFSSINNNISEKVNTKYRLKKVITSLPQDQNFTSIEQDNSQILRKNTEGNGMQQIEEESKKDHRLFQKNVKKKIQNSIGDTQQAYSNVQLKSQGGAQNTTNKASSRKSSTQNAGLHQSNPSQNTFSSHDKSAGPGSGDGIMRIQNQLSPQNMAQAAQMNSVYLQGNRKIEYLTKKSQSQFENLNAMHTYAVSNDDSQTSANLSQRQKYARLKIMQQQQISHEYQSSTDASKQNQHYPQQIRSNYGSQSSSQGSIPQAAIQKAKSNDLMTLNTPIAPQYHHHHNATTMNYMSKMQHQNPYKNNLNFQFQIEQQQLYNNQIPQFQDPSSISPDSQQNLLRKKAYEQRQTSTRQYKSSSGSSMQPNILGLDDYDEGDMYQLEMHDDYGQMYCYQDQFQIPYQIGSPTIGGSADLNMRDNVLNQQNSNYFQHQRFGSSFSQLNVYPDQQQYNQAQQPIEDPIKKTQLSEQKLIKPNLPLRQLYGNKVPQSHISHQSVISNFHGSSGSPQNNFSRQQLQQQQQLISNVLGINSSYDNAFENTSNNQIHSNQDLYEGEHMAPVINMQDLMNVRESYCEKLQGVQTQDSDRQKRLIMMFMSAAQIGSNINLEQLETQIKRMQNRSGRNNHQNNQFQQSLGSGRSHHSQNQKQFDMLLAQQNNEKCNQLSNDIIQLLQQIDADGQQEVFKREVRCPTEENQVLEQNEFTTEVELCDTIKKLAQLLRENGKDELNNNDGLKDQVIRNIGYLQLMSLLDQSEVVYYPTLQLINQICEKSPQHQEIMCLCGFIPYLIRYGSHGNKREIQIEVAYFIGQIYQQAKEALQMFISNQGLVILIEFLSLNYEENKDLVMLAIDSFVVIYDEQTNLQIPPSDLSVILARLDLIENLCLVLPKIIQNANLKENLNDESSAEKKYMEKVFDILQQLANSTNEVKKRFCKDQVLGDIFCKMIENAINEGNSLSVVIMKRFIRIMQLVTLSPNTFQVINNLNNISTKQDIEKHGIIKQQIYDTLKLLNVLCKLSPSRTEQAAMNSLLSPIKEISGYILSKNEQISRNKKSKLLTVILSILTEFITASNLTRQLLIGYNIQQLLLQIVLIQQQQAQNQLATKDHTINAKILDVFVLWLQTDNSQIESFLAKRLTLEIIFKIFHLSPRNKVFTYVFHTLNRMVQLSQVIAKALSDNQQLLEKLSNQLLSLDKSINSSNEDLIKQEMTLGHHHSKKSSSARSINNLLPQGVSENSMKTIDGYQNAPSQIKNSQQAYIMKELMEIFQVLTSKFENGSNAFIDKYNLQKVIWKVAMTAEQHNLVILQQIAQNIMQTYSEKPPQNEQQDLQSKAYLTKQPTVKTRSKSPLFK